MARLIIDTGSDAGLVTVIDRETMTMGRSTSSDLQIIDKRASRNHAVVRRGEGNYLVEDLGSKNGTLLNERPVSGRMTLKNGDRIQIGDTVVIFEREPNESGQLGADTTKSGSVRLTSHNPLETADVVSVHQSTPPIEFGPDGVTPTVDLSKLRDPQDRMRLLLRVAESIRSELDLDRLLTRIMDMVWQVLSPSRGTILLRDDGARGLEPVVVRTTDPRAEHISVSRSIVERSMAEKVSILVSDAPSDIRFSGNDSVVAGQIKSAVCTPLVYQNQVLGVLYVDTLDPSSHYFTQDEMELLTGIANQAATAIANSRLHERVVNQKRLERELEIARNIQINLLPREFPDLEGVTFSAMSLPARQVGGDYYDFLQLQDGRTAIVMADVSGKGVPAAMLLSTIRASLRMEIPKAPGMKVNDMVAEINEAVCNDTANNLFVTMFVGLYDPAAQSLEYCNAGHCHPLLVRADGGTLLLEKGGVFLGVMSPVEYHSEVVMIEEGDLLVFYTDGVTDTHNDARELFGMDRLIALVKENREKSAMQVRDAIHEATQAFRGAAEQFDDLSVVVMRL